MTKAVEHVTIWSQSLKYPPSFTCIVSQGFPFHLGFFTLTSLSNSLAFFNSITIKRSLK